MPDNVDKLFEIMQANGAANDRNKFRKVFLTPGNKGYKIRKDIYDGLRADGIIDSPTYEDFRRKLRLGGTPTVNKYRQQMFNSVDPNKSRASELTHRAVGQAVKGMNNVRKPVTAKVVDQKGKPTGEEFAITPAKTVEDLDREYAQEVSKNWENRLTDQMADADKDAAKISDMFKSFIGSTDEVGSVWGNITRGGGIAGTPHSVTTNNGILENTEARQILAAGDYNRKRRELLQLEKDSRNGAIFDNHSFFRGMYDAAKDTGLLTGGASYLINAGSLLATKQDLDKGVRTEAGDMLMQQVVKNSDAQSQYGDNQGWMYTGGVITTNLAPFMVQIASAGFSKGMSTAIGKVVQGAASKVALGTMKKAAGYVGSDLAKNIGKFTGLSTKAFGKAVQYGIVGAAQANTVGIGNVANDVINRYTGQVYQDEQGNYKFGTFDSDGKLVHEGGEDFLTALVKGDAAQTIEFATELAGGGIDAVGTALKNFVTKGGKKIINKYNMENVSKVIDFLLNNKVSKNARYLKAGADRTLGKVELNSIVGESLEEELGIIANTVFTGDNKISDLWDEKQQSQIWGGMLLSIGLMKGAVAPFHAYNAKQYYSYKHKLDKADVNLSQLLGKEKWEELRNQIDVTTNEDMPELVNKINRNVALGKNRQPVREYIQNLLIMRGYDIGNMLAAKKAVEDKGEGVSVKNMEKNQAYQQGRDAYGYDTHEIQLDQEDKQKSLAQLLGISEQQLESMSDEELEALSGRDDNIDRAIYDYQLSTARYEGVIDNARDQIDLEVQRAAQAVDMYTDKSRNTIRNATIKATGGLEDYGVYIINGNIATHEDGSIDISNSDDMILYYDPTTNTVEHADATMFAELGSEENADEVRNQAMADAKEKAIKETTGIIDGVVEVGTQFKTVDADGTEHTYEVLDDNGDGTAVITIDGNIPTELVNGENVNVPLSFEELQKMKDESDQQRLQAAKAQREQMEKERAEQQMQAQTTKAENPAQEDNIHSAPIEDNLYYSDIIRDDGKVQMVDVSDKDGNNLFPDAKDVFYIQGNKMRTKFAYIDANGELKTQSFPTGLVKIKTRGEVSVDDYKKYRNMILSAEYSAMPESSMIEDNSGENRGEIEVESPTIEGETAAPAEDTAAPESVETPATEHTSAAPAITLEDGTIVPMLEDGNPDFSKLTAEQTAELYDTQFGEDAESVISSWVSDAKKALDKASNMTVKGKNFVEQKAAKDAKEKAIADAQAAYDSAVSIRDAYNERQLAKVEDTAEGRKALIEKARRKFARLKSAVKDDAEAVAQIYKETVGSLLHRLYDSTGIDVTDNVPLTAEEYVASNLGAHSLNYEGTETSKGVKQETGLNREDFAKTQLLAADGKGITIDNLVHSLWENRPSNLESLETQDIRNALIGVLNSGFKASEARNFVENIRIAQAENILEEQKRAQENAAYAEQQKAEQEAELKAKSDEKAESEAKSKAKLDNDLSNESNDLSNETDNEKKNDNINDNINVPDDATDENPLGLQISEDKVPFEIEGGNSGETYDINDNEDRQRLINDNKVDDKDILDIDMPKHVHKAIKELCKKMGLKVQFLYMGARSNGWIENGTMYLALDTEKATQFVFGHEMTHAIKQKNPEAYKELVKVAMAVTTKKKFEEDLAKVYQNYHGISGYNNVDDYVEEVVADNLGKFINDFDLAQKFSLRLNHPILGTILHAIQKIKSLLYGDFYKSVDALERIVEKAYVETANGQVTNSETGEDVSYSLRQKPEPKKKGIGYKVFVLKDGKLYPPMVANPDGAATPVGVWLDADAAPIAGESKTGRPQVKQGGKGTQGGSGKLAYRPGWHLGVVPYAIQFNRKDADGNKTLFPKNFVFAEVEYAADVDYQEEARQEGINPSGKYQHSLAGLKHLPTDGFYMYRTNPNPETDPWVITGAMKVNRILTRAEQAELVKNAGREPQQIQDGDIVTDDVVNSINQEIAAAPKFSLKVYHGSGADFTEFDFDHMGEGAGSQVFGWGGYVTSSKKIGKSYATLMDNDPSKAYYRIQRSNGRRFANKYPTLESFLHGDKQIAMNDKFTEQEKIDFYNEMKKLAEPYHNLYEVDIPEDNGSNYMDWDKPLSKKQQDSIREGLEHLGVDIKTLESKGQSLERTGENVYNSTLYIGLTGTEYDLPEKTKGISKFLSSVGFTGIKYVAGRNFGGAKKGDTNYVIFKPEDMKITQHTKFSLRLKSAIEETETNPSDAQKESGNYKKGHIKFGGYDYTIENPKGSTRSGKDADGKEWKVTMHDTYGYIRGKFGKDGDHLDMFINDKADLDNWNGDVFVVDQVNPDGSFDEHKVMYGYESMDDAKNAYLANYSDGWQGLGNITGVSKDEFDKWLDTSNRKLKPFADYAKVKFSQAQSVAEPRYSLKDEKTMFGMHNISLDKLRKAIKQGGFAAPSMGVIDSKNGIYSDYGEITLIPKAEKLAKSKGKNAGTFTADAWTPVYPKVEKIMTKQGEKAFNADMNKLYENVDVSIWSNIKDSWKPYLLNGDIRDGLYFQFLQEKGMKPEVVRQKGKYDKSVWEKIESIVGADGVNKTELSDTEVSELLKLMNEVTGEDNSVEGQRKALEAEKKDAEKQGNALLIGLLNRRIARLDGEEDYWIADGFMREVSKDISRNGKVKVLDSISTARQKVVEDDKLAAEFNSWLDKKSEQYEAEEMLYNGTTPTGKPKYIPNTIENAVKLMKKQGLAGGYNTFHPGVGAFIAKLSPQVNTLAAMKKAKDKLIPFGDERHNEVRDKILKEHRELARDLQIGESAWDDSGEDRMQELAEVKPNDLKGYIKRNWKKDVSDDWVERYNDLVNTIKNDYPVYYFETKFMRPYGLDEFEKAIVPSDTPSDVVDALKKAGIDVSSYERGNADDRQKVTMDAINSSDNIRFSLKAEKENIVADAKANGTYMTAPNGEKTKLNAEQWATVRTTNFKNWFGDWENDPENASKVVDENGEPMVVWHGRSAEFNTFEKKEGVRFIMGLEDKVKAEGFFFSPDKGLAEEFASNSSRHRGGKANVVPCFLNIRRPMDLTGEDYDRIYEDVTGWEYMVGMDTQDNLWGIMDEEGMADKIKEKGYDGAIFVEEVDDSYEPTKISYCALDANQIKSAENNNGDFSSDNNDIRFSLAGERGAAAADKAEERTFRMDNLSVARKMEEEKKDAKAIKIATGWERGADGKWRYEMPDAKIKLGQKVTDNIYGEDGKVIWYDNERTNPIGTLKDLLDAPELFKAYPELKNIKVAILNANQYRGAYSEEDKTIFTNITNFDSDFNGDRYLSKDVERNLVHEIQHIIQTIEGFGKGGNSGSVRGEIKKKFDEVTKQIRQLKSEGKNEEAKALIEKNKALYNANVNEKDDYKNYLSLAGEVEARNVSARLNMTPEERRKSLAESTEDVARKDQIFLGVGDVSFSLRDMADGKESGVADMAEDLKSLNTPDEVDDAIKTAIDDMPSGWQMANKNIIHIAQALGENRKAEIAGEEPKFSIRTYHGTGASFDKFDLSHALEGEGSESFGHGVYVTNSKEIGGEYAKRGKENKISEWLSNDKNIPNKYRNNENVLDDYKHVAREIAYGKSLDELKAEAERSYKEETDNIKQKINVWEHGEENPRSYEIYFYQNDLEDTPENREKYRKETIDGYKEDLQLYDNMINAVRGMKEEDFANVPRGFRYDVDIPDDNGSNYLDWENTMSEEQINAIRDALSKNGVDVPSWEKRGFNLDLPFKKVYSVVLPMMMRYKPEDVSKFLSSIGFTGIKYPAGMIHGGAKEGDYNYVIFDENNANIVGNTRFSLRGSTSYDKQMEEWMEKNHLENGAVPMEKPIMKEGENIFDYANRMVEWTRNQNLWKTAPKQTGFQDALDKWKDDNGLSPDAYPPVRPHRENYSTEIGYEEDLEEYNKKKELWKSAPKPKDFDLSVDLEDMNKQLRNIRRAVMNQKKYDQRTVKAVSDLVRKMLNIGWGDGLSRGKVGNLLSAAKNATGANDVKKYLDKAMGILAENYLNRLSTAYDNLINTKGARADQSGVIKMGSLDAKGQAFMSEYKKAINMDDSSLNTYIANIEEDSAKNEDNVEMNDYRLAGIQASIMYKQQIGGNDADISELKRQIGELKNKKDFTKEDKDLLKSLEKKLFENKFDRITMYENLLNNIQRMVKESKGRAKEFRDEIAEHKNEILHRANLDLEGVDSTYYDTTTAKKKFVNNVFQRAAFSSTYTFEQFLKFFGKKSANGEGYLYNYFTKLNQDALDDEQLYNEMNRNALDEKTKELFGNDKFMKLVGIDGKGMKEMDIEVTDYSNKKTGKRTIHLKQGQMLYIYLVNKETDGEMKLRAMGITEEDVAAIEENLDTRVKAMGEWLQDEYLPECQRRYQATHTKYFGAPMKEVENYFPLAINNRARNVKEDVNQDSDAMSQLAGTSTGAIVTRRVNVIPLDIENADAFEVAFNHLQEMEEWSAMLPFRQDINTLLSYTHFRNQVQNMSSVAYGSGKTLWDEFKQTAQIAAGTYKPKVNAGMMDSRIAAAMGGIAVAKISGRLWTAIKQSQSATVFLPECDFTRFVKNGVNPYGSWKWAKENIPDFRKRIEKITYGDVKLRQYLDELEKYHDWTKVISKWGMAPNMLVDGITCAVGARSVYETEVNRLTKLGYPKEKAEEKAYYKAVAAYNKTQQSSGGMYLSPMQVDRTYVSAALSLFKNANYAYGRMQIEACRGLARTYDLWGGKHKTTLIESMTRQIMKEDGLDENTARAIAKATYNRTFRQSIGRLINFATLVPVTWALYKVLPYLLTGDDDDKKKDMIEEAVLKGFATSLSDNYVIPFASNILNAGLKVEDGKPTFDPEVFKWQNLYINPATSDLANIYSMIGNQKWYSVANKLGMLGVQMLVGFNPETVGALYQAFAEADYDNGNTAKEWQIGILKAISAPEESIRELYMDELGLKSGDKDAMKKFMSLAGLDADDINKVPLAELEKRYAERQINRDNLLSQIVMDAETFNGYVDKYQKSFEKKIKDKMDKWDEYDKKKVDEFFDTTSDPKLKDMIEKKRTKDANAAADEQISKEGLNQEKKGKEPSEEAYDAVKMSIDVAEDNAISTYNKVLNKRYAAMNDEYNNQTDAMKYIFMSKHPNFKEYKDLESEYTTYGKKIKGLKEKLVSADGYDAKQTILKQIRSEREKFSELQSKVR